MGNGEVGDDEELRGEKQVQKLTDEHTKAIDDLMKHKEAEVMRFDDLADKLHRGSGVTPM